MARNTSTTALLIVLSVFLTAVFFLSSVFLSFLPSTGLASAVSSAFSTSVVVTNQAPVVKTLAAQTIIPATNTTTVVYVVFNASDPNGYTDLNNASALVIINKTGETTRTSSGCAVTNLDANTSKYNCSITIQYYDGSGAWTINASISDLSTNFVQNTSTTVTMNTLDGLALSASSISFNGNTGQSGIPPNATQLLYNTGNQNYGLVNLTAFSFTSGANVINVGNVTVNATANSTTGQILVNNTKVNILGSTLNKGAGSSDTFNFFMSIPVGTPSGTYTSQGSWTFDTT